ncbi:MAG: protease complex subunit PrcB family protein [Candidatus Nealsonbacteria bacterium]|nr:protease complex subunit PrcB family protein [Candidatus Nealsonbacteria bacterium]
MKKIILIIILIITFVVLSGAALVSATGIVKIPVFSDIFYREKISDLGIQANPEAAERLSQKIGFTFLGRLVRPDPPGFPNDVPPDVPPGVPPSVPPGPRTIEITDVELTSWINAWIDETCFFRCPIENFQIKFEKGRYISSARIFDPVEVDITVFGRAYRKDKTSIDLEFDRVFVGNVPVLFFGEQFSREAERMINKNLKNIENLRIDRIEFLDGKVIFEGILPPELGLLTIGDFLPLDLRLPFFQRDYLPTPLPETEIEFQTISLRHTSGHTARKNYVIVNNDDWRSLWNKTYAILFPPPTAPEIDFTRYTIIAVYMGEKRKGGHRIEIVNVFEHKDYVVVLIKETHPEPGAIATMALTQPYHIIKIQKIDKDIVFRKM